MEFEELQDAEDNVIDIAEARGLALPGVVEAAGPIDTNIGLVVVDLHCSVNRGA